jgi:hypothetical protein
MLEDAQVPVVVTQRALLPKLPNTVPPHCVWMMSLANCPAGNPAAQTDVDDLIYVITSVDWQTEGFRC